ncbi:MAG TPA: hypothetical protein VGH99_12225, partial [Pseudonocardia sp.]
MGAFRAFGMAARRWYLLLPLVLVAVGAAYLAYTQMPATYTATVTHQLRTASSGSDSSSSGSDPSDPSESSGPDPSDSSHRAPPADAAALAGELAGKVQPPARGRPRTAAPPYVVTATPDEPTITVHADADSAQRAMDTVNEVGTRLTTQLAELQSERQAPPSQQLRLETESPPTVGPPVRTTGIKVFAVTLAFGLLLAVVLAAAVERSARHRARLAGGDLDGTDDELDEDDRPTEVVPAVTDAPPGNGGDRGPSARAEPVAAGASRPETQRATPPEARRVIPAGAPRDSGMEAPSADSPAAGERPGDAAEQPARPRKMTRSAERAVRKKAEAEAAALAAAGGGATAAEDGAVVAGGAAVAAAAAAVGGADRTDGPGTRADADGRGTRADADGPEHGARAGR